jgi:hypothetical protein
MGSGFAGYSGHVDTLLIKIKYIYIKYIIKREWGVNNIGIRVQMTRMLSKA